MKHVKLFEYWNANESVNGEEFKAFLIKYCTTKEGKEPDEICKRALELLDEISGDSSFGKWLTQGSTLLLQDLLRKTTYNGIGNSTEQLIDFNAFTTLDSACMHFRGDRLDVRFYESVKFEIEFQDEQDGQAPKEEAGVQKWKFSPVPPITVVSVMGDVGEERTSLTFELSNGDIVEFECKYTISPNPADSKKDFATLTINQQKGSRYSDDIIPHKGIDVKEEYMENLENYGSPSLALLKCYEKHVITLN